MKMIVRRNQASAILGILVVVVAFLGIPVAFKSFLLVILGLTIAVFGFTTHRTLETYLQMQTPGKRPEFASTPEALTTGE